jgi:hypothetical protein
MTAATTTTPPAPAERRSTPPVPVPAAAPAARLATALGLAGGALGTLAGLVEVTVGAEIRSWIGNKNDPGRLGLVTVVLALVALTAALVLRRRPDVPAVAPSGRAALGFALLGPGLIGFSTVGRLWYVPGLLLVGSAIVLGTTLRGERRAVVAAMGRSWTTILTGILGLLYLALGLTAHGLAGIAGIAGGLATLGLLALGGHGRDRGRGRGRLSHRPALVLLAVAVAPFALLTWWSLVTPLLALLILVLGAFALAPERRRPD